MTLLKTDSTKKTTLIGAYVSNRVHDYMTLFSLAKGISKSRIFNELFLDWISRQKKIDKDVDLINQIIARVQKTRNKPGNRKMELVVFKDTIEKELTKKGVADDYIAIIISEII